MTDRRKSDRDENDPLRSSRGFLTGQPYLSPCCRITVSIIIILREESIRRVTARVLSRARFEIIIIIIIVVGLKAFCDVLIYSTRSNGQTHLFLGAVSSLIESTFTFLRFSCPRCAFRFQFQPATLSRARR